MGEEGEEGKEGEEAEEGEEGEGHQKCELRLCGDLLESLWVSEDEEGSPDPC